VATLSISQRIRRLIARGARSPNASIADTPKQLERDLGPGLLAVEQESVTDRIFARLSEQEVSDIERQILDSDLREHYAEASHPQVRRHMILAFGTWLGSPAILEKTGLSQVQPPEDIHAMVRGPYAAAGGLYEANLVTDALVAAGQDPLQIRDALDFGCSSGRVVRSLATAYPQATWHGCDPNGGAITWASENLPAINFFLNGDAPPLSLPDGSLDLIYAISIWSHFEPALGLRWFEEMRRLIRPGGCLMCTTHGWTSIAHYALNELRSPQQSEEIRDALYRKGWWYAPEFGEEGDWGVLNPDWGTAFLSPEWLLTQLCPRWRVLEFAPGRNQDNQDVFVLQRV
jgi:SAM-dependent methyltransferase